MKKRAIIFSAHPWGGPFRLGAHHIAKALARADWDVLYVAAPISPPHIAALPFSARARLRLSEALSPPKPAGVRVIAPVTATPLSAHWGATRARNLQDWPHRTQPLLAERLRNMGFLEPDLALLDGPLQAAAAKLAQPRRLVLRVFDRFTHMPGMSPAMLELARSAAQEADLVVYSARALAADAAALGARRALHLPNGVDAAHFAPPRPAPREYGDIPRPRAIYVGQTGSPFDVNAVAALAQRRPAISIIILGPPNARLGVLRGMENVRMLGPRDWEVLPAYLQHADIGLAPMDVGTAPVYVEGINPLKLYEYLASGLPVVATRWKELEQLEAPGVFLSNPDAFDAALEPALAATVDKAALAAFAQAHDWSGRMAMLLDALR
jgi:glycosyltransferase involved in cell wall biosynthesis